MRLMKKSIGERAYSNGKYTFDLALQRARSLNAFPKWADNAKVKNQILQIYINAQFKNLTTKKRWHVDHIIPLCGYNVCGLHVPTNLRIISKTANEAKSNVFTPYFEKNGVKQYYHEGAVKKWNKPFEGASNPTKKSLQKLAGKLIFNKRNFFR